MMRSARAPVLSAMFLALSLGSLTALPAAPLETTLIARGAVWKYLDNGTDQGTAWRDVSFFDELWASGPAELGYGDGDEQTLVSYGPNAGAKYITTYFRHTFAVANPETFTSLTLRILRDDGAVVYLNGTEVFRTNMPGGTVTYTTLASVAVEETTYHQASVSPSLLLPGTNVLAVEIHQANGTSSDISLNAELIGSDGGPTVTRGPYLQQGTPSSVVVRWRTSVPTDSRVRYGTVQGSLSSFADDPAVTTEHAVTVPGLSPDTRYTYSVGTASGALAGDDASHFFVTPPPAGTAKPTRIWVLGDSGTANANAAAVRDAYTAFTGAAHTDLWLMLGDNAYATGTDAEYQAAVFNMFTAMLKKSVLWPTRGNHDQDAGGFGSTYYSLFTLPTNAEAGGLASGTEAYYSYDYGNLHFICLDSYGSDRSAGGSMATWLASDLAATSQEWIIAYWHHPPYSKGSHDSDVELELVEMRQNLLPILEEGGVDLVLGGHSHSYERSFLLDGHYGPSSTLTGSMIKNAGGGREDGTGAYAKAPGTPAHQGAVYTVVGSSGQISGGALNHPAMFLSLNNLGSLVLDVNGGRMDVKFIRETASVADYFTILKSAGGSPTTVSFQNGVFPTPTYAGTRDTYLSQNSPNSKNGNLTTLRVDGDDPGGTGRDLSALLKWDIGAIPPGSVVQSASIGLTVTNAGVEPYGIYEMKRPWMESHATWNRYANGLNWQTPGAQGTLDRGFTLLGTVVPPALGAYSVSLNAAGVALVQSWVDTPALNQGLILAGTASVDGVAFSSREFGTPGNRPKLTVTYLPGGAAPTRVAGRYETNLEEEPGEASDSSSSFVGGCGATGLEVLVLLGLAALLRRPYFWRMISRPSGS